MDRVKRRWKPDPAEEDMTGRPRQEDRTRQFSHRRTARPAPGPAILTVGTWSGEAIVPADVLIGADTLEAEQAVCRWLAEHGLQVTASRPADPAGQAR